MLSSQLLEAIKNIHKFDETQHPRDEHGRFTDGGAGAGSLAEELLKGEKFEIPDKLIKVKFHTHLKGEDPNMEFALKAVYPATKEKFADGTERIYPSKADIQALDTGLSFPPINTVLLSDLIHIKK